MPVLGGPAVLGILPEEPTGKDKARQEAAAAATKADTDLTVSPAENRRRIKTPEQVATDGTALETNAALDERPSLSGWQAAAEVQFEGLTIPAAADIHC